MRRTDKSQISLERRKERLYRDKGKWYYHIRDGLRGPFSNRKDAQEDLKRFVVTKDYMESNPKAVPDDLDIDDVTHIELKPPRY